MTVLYEINTAVWMGELSGRYGRRVTLGEVPGEAWDEIALPGVDTVWLMGVWERSPAGLRIALRDEALRNSFRAALPDVTEADIAGSPYCVRDYVVDASFGGPEGLAEARAELAARGLRLILDFVPNHIAPDHPWVTRHPDRLIHGTADDLSRTPGDFIESDGRILARGRDPFFPPWPDVVQLNAFGDALRTATVDTLVSIGDQADGVRCDMAMLLMNDVFAKTWGDRAGPVPAEDSGRTSSRVSVNATRTCSSSRRRTGTSNGPCSSRVSTTATTSGCTTDSCTRTPTPSAPIWGPTSPTSEVSSAFSRTTTNHGRPPPCPVRGDGRQPWPSPPCPARRCGTRASSRDAGSAPRCSSRADRRSPSTSRCAPSTTGC